MDWDKKTIETYDQFATQLAKYFSGIGPRVKYIERALKLAKAANGQARVVEIGCGDGRDAAEIIKRVAFYEGFDPSEGLLKIARKNLPQASFVLANSLSYNYPANIDVVFAFASLLHVNKEDLKSTFVKVAKSLRPGGILYLSLKERAEYKKEVKKDEYGERMFYFYNQQTISELSKDLFKPVFIDHEHIGSTDWLEIALQRI